MPLVNTLLSSHGEDVTPYPPGCKPQKKSFFVSSEPLSWNDALNTCRTSYPSERHTGGTLLSLRSEAETEAFRKKFISELESRFEIGEKHFGVWIGGHDIGHHGNWTWIDSDGTYFYQGDYPKEPYNPLEGTQNHYTNWLPGHPDGLLGIAGRDADSCLQATYRFHGAHEESKRNLMWNDHGCHESLHFVCQFCEVLDASECAETQILNAEKTECVECDYGQVPNANKTACEECPAGQVPNDGGTCEECSAGRVPNADKTACKECPADQIPNADQSACETCPAGQVANADGTACEVPAPTPAPTKGDPPPDHCWYDRHCNAAEAFPDHNFSSSCEQVRCDWDGGATAGKCVIGPKSAGIPCRTDRGLCDWAESCDGRDTQCPLDVIKNSTHVCRTAASDCDESEFCTGDSDFCPEDVRKGTDTVCRPAKDDCDVPESCDGKEVNCPVDHSKPTNPDGTCKECPAGQVFNAGACEACPADQIPNADKTACEVCPTFEQPNADGTACEVPPARTVECPTGQVPNDEGTCECPVGQIMNADNCEACPTGHVTNADKTACEACPTDRVPNGDKTACEECPADQVPNMLGTKCEVKTVCDAGQIDRGGNRCEECPPGLISNFARTECVCGPGMLSDPVKVCVECPVGSITNPEKTACIPCDAKSVPNRDTNACVPRPPDCPKNVKIVGHFTLAIPPWNTNEPIYKSDRDKEKNGIEPDPFSFWSDGLRKEGDRNYQGGWMVLAARFKYTFRDFMWKKVETNNNRVILGVSAPRLSTIKQGRRGIDVDDVKEACGRDPGRRSKKDKGVDKDTCASYVDYPGSVFPNQACEEIDDFNSAVDCKADFVDMFEASKQLRDPSMEYQYVIEDYLLWPDEGGTLPPAFYTNEDDGIYPQDLRFRHLGNFFNVTTADVVHEALMKIKNTKFHDCMNKNVYVIANTMAPGRNLKEVAEEAVRMGVRVHCIGLKYTADIDPDCSISGLTNGLARTADFTQEPVGRGDMNHMWRFKGTSIQSHYPLGKALDDFWATSAGINRVDTGDIGSNRESGSSLSDLSTQQQHDVVKTPVTMMVSAVMGVAVMLVMILVYRYRSRRTDATPPAKTQPFIFSENI